MLEAASAQHRQLEEEAQRAQRGRAEAEANVQGLKEAVEHAQRAQRAAEVGTDVSRWYLHTPACVLLGERGDCSARAGGVHSAACRCPTAA